MWIIFKATFLLFTSVSDVFLKITMEEVIVTVWPPYSLKIRKTKQNNFEVIIDFDFFFLIHIQGLPQIDGAYMRANLR